MISIPAEVNQILRILEDSKTICVTGHVLPDGDCVGSQLALAYALKGIGKKVYCWNADEIPDKLVFLDPEGCMRKPRAGCSFDAVVSLDCASFERLGPLGEKVANRKHFINIDHHESNTRYADINWVVGHASSTGELIFQLMQWARWEVTPKIAACLFTAISTDTGSFQYRGTTPETFEMAGKLLEFGVDLEDVCEEVYQSYPIERIKLLRQVLNNFKLAEDNRIAYYWLKPSDYSRSGAEREDSEGLIDHIRAIAPVVVAVQFEEVSPEVIRVCMRSKNPNLDVSEVVRLFGGGGHRGASGATIQGTRLSVQRKVMRALRLALKEARKRKKSFQNGK